MANTNSQDLMFTSITWDAARLICSDTASHYSALGTSAEVFSRTDRTFAAIKVDPEEVSSAAQCPTSAQSFRRKSSTESMLLELSYTQSYLLHALVLIKCRRVMGCAAFFPFPAAVGCSPAACWSERRALRSSGSWKKPRHAGRSESRCSSTQMRAARLSLLALSAAADKAS
eukprot:6206353-Pleurochrysis_carterae.AAC.3